MANEKNLYQRILAVSAEIKNVEKNLSVEVYGGKSYKAVADYDVVVAVKNAEAKHGILSIPVSQELVEHEIMEYTTSKGDRKTQFVDIVKMTLRLVNVDDPTQFLDITTFGRGIDNGDKSFGKASTYARKYGLLNAYKIATGEDPDQQGSEEGQYKKQPSTPAMTDKLWWQLVRATAEGKKTKSGQEPFEWWKATYNPTPEQIQSYGEDVERVRAAMKAE